MPPRIKMDIDNKTKNVILKLRGKYNCGQSKIKGYIKVNKPKGISPISHNIIYDIFY
jgi:hypothetical protein